MNKFRVAVYAGIFFTLITTTKGFGQNVSYLTTLSGLNNGAINDIVQDSAGFIWLATWDGITRYDGYSMVNYRPLITEKDGLPSRQTFKLYLDSRNNLWALTYLGISRYNRNHDRFEKYYLENLDSTYSIGSNSNQIFEVDGTIYYNLANQLYWFSLNNNSSDKQFKELTITGDVPFPGFRIIKLNNQFFILKNYLLRNNSELLFGELIQSPEGTVMQMSRFLQFEGLVSNILSIDSTRHIFTRNREVGMYTATGSGIKFEVLIEGINPKQMLFSSDNKLWVLPVDGGLGRLDLHTGNYEFYDYDNFHADFLLGNQISSLFEDFSGNLWIGHAGEGLSIINLMEKSFHTFRNNPESGNTLSCNSVMAFCETPHGLLIGTDYEGVDIMKTNPYTGKVYFSNLRFPESFLLPTTFTSIWSIAKENDDLYWMAGNFGLIKTEYKQGEWALEQFLMPENNIMKLRTISFDKNNNLWLGTYEGLYLFPANQRDSMGYFRFLPDQANPHAISDDVITAILIDSQNRFWVGTRDQGINLLEIPYSQLKLTGNTPPDLRFKKFLADTLPNSLNSFEINCLYEHDNGTIWAGTQGGGVNIIDPLRGTIRHITKEEGLPGSNVFAIESAKGMIWLSTNKGLCSVIEDGIDWQITRFNPSDGVQGNIFMVHSSYKGSDDRLYFGGRNGFTYFNPSEIHRNIIPPKIVFTDLRLFDQKIEIGQVWNKKKILSRALNETDTLTISYKDYNIRIGVAAIHFQDPSENKVLYKLDGLDNTWNTLPNEDRSINFANLNPGKYTLMIRASNSDNIWADEIRTLHLIVTPPWYKTWYGYSLFGLILLLLIIGLFYIILRQQLLRHKIELDEQQMENMKQLNESKLRFFTNISHDLRTPLSLVLAPIEYLYKNEETNEFIKEQLALSLRNAKMLKRLITNIIDFRKFDAGKLKLKYERLDIKEFISYIGKNFESIQSSKNTNLLYHLPDNVITADFDPMKMEQIMYNLLSNAFKHASIDGSVLLTLENKIERSGDKLPEESIKISIFNEGETIPDDQVNMIFERFHQANNSGEGSGIGLSVAEKLIALHDGTINVRNIENNGVEFSIVFPRYTDQKNLIDTSQSYKLQDEGMLNLHKHHHITKDNIVKTDKEKDLKIVVIEDNDELRAFYKTLLSKDYQFFEAADGSAGIKLVEEVIPDIVISDVVMPEKYGYEVCKYIKENLQTCHIPVILLTAKDAPDQIVLGYRSGADAYITKPFDYEILMTQLKSIISNRELLREKYCSTDFIQESVIEKPKTKDDLFMEMLNSDIEENLFNDDYNVVSLSHKLNISRNHLYRKVKALTGHSTVEYIRILKLNRAAELLKTQQYSIKEVCYMTGFRDQSYFTKSFKNHFKLNPTEYIRNAANA